MTIPHRKFAFDTVFDEGGEIASAPAPTKRSYTPDEVEQIRQRAYAEGERTATVQAEERIAATLAQMSAATGEALGDLSRLAHQHRTACAELALAAGRAIAGAALDAFPEAPAAAALETLAHEIDATPRLIVRAAPELVARLQASLDKTAADCGFPGQIVVKADANIPMAAFVFDWGDGRASFDPVEAGERVAAALHTALAAEGLHAEPLRSAPPPSLSPTEA
jgi:flagellar assembly protein FliH